jgi:Outer membrane protein beta-barrel domain
MRKIFLLAATLLACSATAGAADNGIYLGGSLARSMFDVDLGVLDIDDDDNGFKIIAGVRPLDWFAIEANYIDFGKVREGVVSVENDAFSAYGVGFLALGPVDVFGKLGLVKSDASVRVRGFGEVLEEDGTDPAYGFGVQFRLLSISVRAEYEVFDVDNVDDLNLFSIGLTYTFL